jgi:uncharacterized membrane protein
MWFSGCGYGSGFCFIFRKSRGTFCAKESSNANTGYCEETGDLSRTLRGYNYSVMSFLRYLMLLSLVVWIGGLIFFAFVLAPTAFNIPDVLPNTHLAGNVVGRALGKLHWIAIVSGIVFLGCSLIYSRLTEGMPQIFATRHVLIGLMLALTLFSQFWIIPRMDTLRTQVSDMASVPIDNPIRIQFDALHVWSTRVEGAVLLLGLIEIYFIASAFHQP